MVAYTLAAQVKFAYHDMDRALPVHFVRNIQRASSTFCHPKFGLFGGGKVPYDMLKARMLNNLSGSEGHPPR